MIGYTETSENNKSATRLVFLIGSIWNMALTTYLAYKNVEPIILAAVFSSIQAVFIALKLGQKPMENNEQNKVKNINELNKD